MKILVIIGPTASGKTSLAVKLAKRLNGEIVSADSRQVYEGMDIGTGKDKKEYEQSGVKVWGLDLVRPDYTFNVSDYVKFARAKLEDIHAQGKLPIVVGGTVLYIKGLLSPFETIDVPPDSELRDRLAKYSVTKLQNELAKLDKNRWSSMNASDRSNPRRLVRAIEVASKNISLPKFPLSNDNEMIICLNASLGYLYQRIDTRVEERIKQGAVEEVKSLLQKGYDFSLPSMSATGYREFENYKLLIINDKLTQKEVLQAVRQWKFNEHDYARRQISFIKKFVAEQERKGKVVRSFNIENRGWDQEASEAATEWYSNSDD